MGTLRLEPTRVQAWAARSATAVWNAFDVQLVIYALLLAVVGVGGILLVRDLFKHPAQ